MSRGFSFVNLFPRTFHSAEVDVEELEKIIEDAVRKDSPLDRITNIEYTDDGVVVTLNNGEQIEIEVDWEEIILK